MTIAKLIARIDDTVPGAQEHTIAEKLEWLTALDGQIFDEIISQYAQSEEIRRPAYDESTDVETDLLVAAPWDGLYMPYLEAQIAYCDREMEVYNNAMAVHAAILKSFRNHYNRTHVHIGSSIRYF